MKPPVHVPAPALPGVMNAENCAKAVAQMAVPLVRLVFE